MNDSNKSNWQNALINAVTDPAELLSLLTIDESYLHDAKRAAELFPLKVPRSFIARMKKGDPFDPLLRQVLPLGEELKIVEGYGVDPLREEKANPIPGLLHKYKSRVLLIFSGSCGINCRFCFRRNFPYENNNPGVAGWEKALAYIAEHTEVSEVILSGGDPLVASDAAIKTLMDKLAGIEHVKRFRIHSRMPIVMPERVTDEFTTLLSTSRFKSVLVVHANHPNEINEEVKGAVHRLKSSGVTLLNHSVLLKGVNDDAEILKQLSERLFECGILPYYLNTFDKVQGAAHFDSDIAVAKKIYAELQSKVSGYLLPKLGYEKPGAASKIIVVP